MFNRLVSLGSVLLDISMRIPALPEKGQDAFADFGFSMIGGGHNIESAAARLGMKVLHVGSVGVGPNSSLYESERSKEGIDFAGQVFEDEDLGICVTLITPEGERTFITQGGAESRMTIEHLNTIKLGPTDVLYFAGYELYHPGSKDALKQWLLSNPLNGAALVFDPTSMLEELDQEVFEWIRREAFVITANESEFARLAPRATDRALFVRRVGAEGCELYEAGELRQKVAGVPAKVVDTTGAGDVHTGALIASLAQGKTWPQALEVANRAASFCVAHYGGATGPTLEEL